MKYIDLIFTFFEYIQISLYKLQNSGEMRLHEWEQYDSLRVRLGLKSIFEEDTTVE
jgi:hypothetical protein